jgi:hypothetical protein
VEAGQKRIMNINIFTQLNQELVPEEQRSKTVIIMAGGTGLAEAVFYALDKGFQVKWVPGRRGANFAIGQPQDVVKLPYFRHLASVEKNPEQQQKYEQEVNRLENSSFLIDLYQIQDQNTFQNIFESFQNKAFDQIHLTYLKTAEHTDTGVVATLQNGETVTGDYLVYAMGADLSTFEIFDKNVLNNLEPLVDKNRRFQLLDGDTAPTTLGLKTKDDLTGSSLKIIGSMAARLVPRIDANHTMGQVLRYLPDNAVFNDVLPPIRSSIEAANNFLPYDINERVNYSVGDNQALATHIVANFPAIADLD